MHFLNVTTQIIVLLPIDLASVSFNVQLEHLLTHEIFEVITAQMVVIPAGIPVFVFSTSPVCKTCSALGIQNANMETAQLPWEHQALLRLRSRHSGC